MKTETELIHEFMGCDWKKEQFQWRPGSSVPMTLQHLDYYKTSWNWLMPVVEKIETIGTFKFSMLTDGESCFSDLDHRIFAHGKRFASIGKTRIESTYKAVVAFIKWYNQQTHGTEVD